MLLLLVSTAPLPRDAERGFFLQGNEQDHTLGVDGVVLGRQGEGGRGRGEVGRR